MACNWRVWPEHGWKWAWFRNGALFRMGFVQEWGFVQDGLCSGMGLCSGWGFVQEWGFVQDMGLGLGLGLIRNGLDSRVSLVQDGVWFRTEFGLGRGLL